LTESAHASRRRVVTELKRSIILDAALELFETEGLDGTSMRAIAKRVGYSPAAIYGYFPSKEHIYAAALSQSLDGLRIAIASAVVNIGDAPVTRFCAAGLAFFDFYDAHPRDLVLGFYLFRGGIRPRGLTTELNRDLNAELLNALDPLRRAAVDHGADETEAADLTAEVLAHAFGLILLAHTGRMALFGSSARQLLQGHLDRLVASVSSAN
jgi:AcrR family transcriptional regulator